MINYDMILCDYDGTLARYDGTVSEECKSAIRKYREAGGLFVLCTGRGLSAALPCCKDAGLTKGPLCILHGTAIVELGSLQVLRRRFFPYHQTRRLLEMLEREKWNIHVYTLDRIFSNRRDFMLTKYEVAMGVKVEAVRGERIIDLVAREELSVAKVLILGDPQMTARARDQLACTLQGECEVMISSACFTEILPKGQNKGVAVDYLSERLGIPRSRIAAIGDEENDYQMLRKAGGKFVVKNGAPMLKEIATEVPSNTDDGVAYAIRKYVMGETDHA